jgi:hypothetical protein
MSARGIAFISRLTRPTCLSTILVACVCCANCQQCQYVRRIFRHSLILVILEDAGESLLYDLCHSKRRT